MRWVNKVRIFCIVIILLVVGIVLPTTVNAEGQYPKPTMYKYVNDYTGLLNQGDTDKLVSLARELEDKTGAEAAIVVIGTLNGHSIEEYANGLFREWGIGKKDKNNGLLILIVKNDRKYRVEVGTGLEGVLPDLKCKDIMETYATPKFKNDKYAEGLINSYSVFCDSIAKAKNLTLDNSLHVKEPSIQTQLSDSLGALKDKFVDSFDIGKYGFFLICLVALFKNRKKYMSRRSHSFFGTSYSDSDSSSDSGSGSDSSDFGGGSSDGGGSSGDW
ncbi:TPM domain-containing protein [Inconstantimicrobium mannanitabidum]|uniref:Uncharacterized protein n=1 Tax=Inconstantimicrobium mannanitabidum TaxID=1604901 RepID=A0ACB5R891_9CLOT|nr:TPM domain-containing protein [Clostridium sp. TW13]GKX65233.1 hypothetical protein rsdtw13_04910 [Clostridium sp. TW13]